jgi:hypothetical protein
VSWCIGDRRFGTGRKGNRNDDVVERQRRIFEFVFEVDSEVSRIGRRPAVD